jgi:hypothetical protein
MSAPAVASPISAADRIGELLQRVEYRLAVTDEDREAIFRLRYEAYLREGAIRPSFRRSFSDGYDDLDNTWIVGVFLDGGRLVSSMRLHVANGDFPETVATHTFPDYVVPVIKQGYTIVDPTRFVVDDAAARAHPELHYVTVRIGHMAAEHFDADIVLAAVRREHQAFYKRVFGHKAVCEPRPYLNLVKPLGLMSLHYPAERDRILARFPFFGSTEAERSVLFGEPFIPSRPEVELDDLVPALAG